MKNARISLLAVLLSLVGACSGPSEHDDDVKNDISRDGRDAEVATDGGPLMDQRLTSRSDVGRHVPDAELPTADVDTSDSRMSGDGAIPPDADPYPHEVSGDVQNRPPCTTVCQNAGFVCDENFEHYLLGPGGGLVRYEAEFMISCVIRPAAEDNTTGTPVALQSYTCFCR